MLYKHIETYNHNGRVGVLVEIETLREIAAEDEFKEFSRNLAMHIAAEGPANEVERESLMKQKLVQDTTQTIAEYIEATEKRLDAPIKLIRFVRYGKEKS